ncbi:hypothetical protein DPEC_G00158120 [Dallia pectoralis]|uniref:Uncharacterized protein n=1 Tax=Dallia pectoralis TaxID=75939 RepID=A0ACC2GL13_DALPE|nr:hypothetical protein DPEC_G00158120 [Dallia pectoralis]
MLKGLMEKFVKPSVMKDATTPVKLLQVDYANSVNHIDVTKMRIGFVTERALEEHMKQNSSEKLSLEFRQNCKLFLLKMVSKLFEKAPLKYPLVRGLSVLDPRVLLKSKETSVRKLDTVLRLLVESGRIEEQSWLSVSISTFSLVAIAIERYSAICNPLKSRAWQTRSHAYRVIAVTWALSLVIMVPYPVFSQLKDFHKLDQTKGHMCRLNWPSVEVEQTW